MRVRVESSTFLIRKQFSGVGYYSKLLTLHLKKQVETSSFCGPLNSSGRLHTKINRVYAKLVSLGLQFPVDLLRRGVDLTIFPNFSLWPTLNSKVCATVIHDLTYLHYPETTEKKNLAHLRRVVPRAIKRSDFIITVSQTVKKEIIETFDINENRIVVTHIPPSDNFLNIITPNVRVADKYSLPSKKYILFIGNQEPRKNLSLLIASFASLPDKIKDVHSLVIAGGDSWKSEEYERRLAIAIKSGIKIVRLGYVPDEDLPYLYRQASVFVLPSLYEGFGMPLLEAMASGVPVIAADIPALNETCGDAAIYIDPTSVEELSRSMELIISDSAIARKMVVKGYNNLMRFSWSDNIKLIINKTNSILK